MPIFNMVAGGKSVTESIVGHRTELTDVFVPPASGRVKFDQVNDVFSDMEFGKIAARAVFQR